MIKEAVEKMFLAPKLDVAKSVLRKHHDMNAKHDAIKTKRRGMTSVRHTTESYQTIELRTAKRSRDLRFINSSST